AQQRALRFQLTAAIEHDVVLERLGVQPLRADVVELADQLLAVAQREFDFNLLRHHDTRSTSTPGSFWPAMNSSDAPPPVEMWLMRSAKPDAFTASTDSPPPTTLVAFASATARAIAIVPFANASFSNTPIGPFQKIVLARLMVVTNFANVCGPMSTAI